ncbi:MAG: SDR family NAD(P)-dependent oxidoreductase, partial [Rhizobacter sp.]
MIDGREQPRTAGISSFGAGGSNAHLIVQEHVDRRVSTQHEGPALVLLSARTEERLRVQVQRLIDALSTSEEELHDIAYTLQVGREAMEVRLACVVDSREALQQRLQTYLEGRSEADLYSAEVKRHKEALAVFAGEEELQRAVQAWISQGRLAKLAELWVKGLVIDWGLLHANGQPRRVSLPTYAFAQERYWVPALPEAPEQGQAQLHPLLHANTSDLQEQRYSSRFSGEEFFLREHVVHGRRVLPGVAQLEMAREAVMRATGSASVRLEGVVFASPIVVGEEGLQVHIALQAEGEGTVGYEIYSEGATGEEQVHGQGRAVLSAAPQPRQFELAALRTSSQQTLSREDLYTRFQDSGLHYGPAFQALQRVQLGQDEHGPYVLGEIEHTAEPGTYTLHPGVLDAALQASLGFALDAATETHLPFALERLEVMGELPSKAVVVIRRIDGKLDLSVCNADGHEHLRLNGLTYQPITAALGEEDATASVGELTLVPTWDTSRLSPPGTPEIDAEVLIVGAQPAERDTLRMAYPRATWLDLLDDDPESLKTALAAAGASDHVVWIAPAMAAATSDEQAIDSQRTGALGVFRLIKALIASGHDTKRLSLTAITRQAVGIDAQDPVHPGHASVHGLLGSVAKEYPRWKVRVLDLPACASDWPLVQLATVPPAPEGNALAWRRGEWYQQRLLRGALLPSALPYRQGGVYVILGGAGGLGVAFSEHLIKTCQAQVVWIGRRPEDAAIAAQRERLAGFGPAPLYISADATDLDALQGAHDQVRQRFGAVHGVVHATIVLHDKSVAGMDEAVFQASLDAKVQTSVRMAQVLTREPLDFVLFFSSMQSMQKGAGQGNYAAGCTFADAYAQALRQRGTRVKVVNWGYWGSVGVVASQAYRDRMHKLGIGSIDAAEAMPMLERLLGSAIDQVAYLKTSDAAVTQAFAADGERITQADTSLPASTVVVARATNVPAPLDAQDRARTDTFETLIAQALCSQLQWLGLFEASTLSSWTEAIGLPPLYRRWLAHSLDLLQARGLVRPEGLGYAVAAVDAVEAAWPAWQAFREQALREPGPSAHVALVHETLEALPQILRGRQAATAVMFPRGSMSLMEGVYKHNKVSDHFNAVLAETLLDYLARRSAHTDLPKLRIVEIGAGTGGTSALLFERLAPWAQQIGEYCYTDISKSFLLHGQQHYAAKAPYLTTRLLDVSQPLAAQGFEAGSYDVLVATNVLHATPNIRHTLRNAKALLKGQGLMLLNEVTGGNAFAHLTFGLLEGWWLYEDQALRVAGTPALAPQTWRDVLAAEGFHTIAHPAENAHDLGQQVIAAYSDGVVRQRAVAGAAALARPATVVLPAAQPVQAPAVPAPLHSERGDEGELRSRVQNALASTISQLLQIDPKDLDPDSEFSVFGFDSISLTGFAGRINELYGLELTPTVLFEYPTIARLGQHLLSEHSAALARHLPDAARLAAVPMQARIPQTQTQAAPLTAGTLPGSRRRTRRDAHESRERPGAATPTSSGEPIAVIGMSGSFPKARDLQAFWENLRAGRDCIDEIPDSRWDWSTLYGDPKGEGNKTNARRAGLMDGMAEFDPLFFGISPGEAQGMDPQQRLLMTHVWSVFEDAGYAAQGLSGSDTAIFVGTTNSGYAALAMSASGINGNSASGASVPMGPNRMSFLLDLHGPSEPIDTACSSALVAIHKAVQALRSGQTRMAVAGGVNTLVAAAAHVCLSKSGMLCEDGKCKTFSRHADGFVRGEGVGMLLLKKLGDAERDGDHIYGLIRGSAQNHGGRANSLTAPNPRSQAELVKAALREAGVAPRTVGYIEAHGTGTPLGDPIEVQGLKTAFKEFDAERDLPEGYCAVGSVKTNIGHLEVAAGVAGVIKVLLQMKHRTLVKSLHSEELNPYIELKDSPFYVVQQETAWQPLRDERGEPLPRRAGVSSFGFGGVNAHVVLEEYVPAPRVAPVASAAGLVVIVLSARSEERLKEVARQLRQDLVHYGDADLPDIAYTLQVGRDAMEARIACEVDTLDALRGQLDVYLEGRPNDGLFTGNVKRNKETLGLFSANEELQEAIDKWVGRGKLRNVLDLWVKGLAFDWRRLHAGAGRKRLSLPTYPFGRERYWFDTSPVDTPVTTGAAQLHPLLHANTSRLNEQRFSSRYSGEEFFLRDHQVQGRKVLPGVAQLEMAREAVVRALELAPAEALFVRLENVVFARPIVVGSDGLQVHITLESDASDAIGYEIHSDEAGEAVLHGQGRAVLVRAGTAPRVDLASLAARCTARMEAAQIYGAFAQGGLGYGPTFQGLQSVQAGEDAAGWLVIGELKLPEALQAGRGDYQLHPSLMDAALQATMGMVLGRQAHEEGTQVPFALERLEVFAALPERASVVVRASASQPADGSVRKLDLSIVDAEGQVCVQLSGFSSRVLSGTHGESPRTRLLVPAWQAEEAPTAGAFEGSRHVLLCESPTEPLGAFERLEGGAGGAAERYERHAAQLLARLQALMAAPVSGEVLVQLVVPVAGEAALMHGLGGLLNSAGKENPRLRGQVIAIEPCSSEQLTQWLDAEAAGTARRVRHHAGRREVSKVAPCDAPPAVALARDRGVYLITGGAGGLGLLFAQAMAKQARDVTLVLTGRGELSEAKRAQFEALPARVDYRRVDVCDAAALERLVAEVCGLHGELSGVIHSAGVLRD